MSRTITETTTYIILDCYSCHVHFGVSEAFNQDKLDNRHNPDRRAFWCPNGHRQHYMGDSEAEVYRKKLHAKELEASRIAVDRDAAWAEVGKTQRAKAKVEREKRRLVTRVHAGVCPCCNRTFSQLARHMANQHPEFKE